MFHSAALALARLQMNRPKRNGPPEKPEGLNGDHAALWSFLLHLNGRIDGLYVLAIGAILGVIAIFVTVLVK